MSSLSASSSSSSSHLLPRAILPEYADEMEPGMCSQKLKRKIDEVGEIDDNNTEEDRKKFKQTQKPKESEEGKEGKEENTLSLSSSSFVLPAAVASSSSSSSSSLSSSPYTSSSASSSSSWPPAHFRLNPVHATAYVRGHIVKPGLPCDPERSFNQLLAGIRRFFLGVHCTYQHESTQPLVNGPNFSWVKSSDVKVCLFAHHPQFIFNYDAEPFMAQAKVGMMAAVLWRHCGVDQLQIGRIIEIINPCWVRIQWYKIQCRTVNLPMAAQCTYILSSYKNEVNAAQIIALFPYSLLLNLRIQWYITRCAINTGVNIVMCMYRKLLLYSYLIQVEKCVRSCTCSPTIRYVGGIICSHEQFKKWQAIVKPWMSSFQSRSTMIDNGPQDLPSSSYGQLKIYMEDIKRLELLACGTTTCLASSSVLPATVASSSFVLPATVASSSFVLPATVTSSSSSSSSSSLSSSSSSLSAS
jgi:hypothetical protein